ncbi:thyrotropin-releasing hormone-degrading ectoenzyme-like, partial [Pseudomyrmex gracilis]|uniref:thyrotropin-releasing hormone-degrading ectoenzyme-like n=1 Tax=Pseudomyrmex gracilis TaxID=219809 RepID=UPI0009958FDD
MWYNIIPQSYVHYLILPITVTHYENILIPRMIFLSEVNIIYDKEVDSLIKKRKATCSVARTVIQEMFSDWLVPFRQSDLWFIEGFSTVYGVYITDQYYNTSLLKSIVVQTRRIFLDYIEAITYESPFRGNSLISRTSTFTKLWREKAFSTFYMLNTVFQQDFLYTSLFQEAVHLYYYRKKTSNNTYNKLSLLDKLWNRNFETYSLYKNVSYIKLSDIKNMITSWTAQSGYPVIQVNRHNDTQSVSAEIRDCFDVNSTVKTLCKQKWWIPVTFKKLLNTQVLATYYHILKPDSKMFISLLYENQITIVVDQLGYRVNYDRYSWKNIAFFLKTGGSVIAELSDVTLAQLLDDAFYFLVQNTKYNENYVPDKIDLDIYLELASSIFHVNNSYTAWYPVLIALENMSKIVPFPESVLSRNIKNKLLEILNKFLDDISYTHSSENSANNQFYHEVLKWTCILRSLKCKEHVNGILNWHFNHPTQNKLLPSWQKWIYCQRLMLDTVTYETSAV